MLHRFFKRYQFINTRRYLRLPTAWPVKCHVLTSTEGRHVTTTQDVSAGGIRLLMPQKIAIGHQVQVEIYVPPKDRLLSLRGEVVRCTAHRTGNFELGIRFHQVDPEDRLLLNLAVKRSGGPRSQVLHRRAWWRTVS